MYNRFKKISVKLLVCDLFIKVKDFKDTITIKDIRLYYLDLIREVIIKNLKK